jgi:lipoyl(octanoyl) transferase
MRAIAETSSLCVVDLGRIAYLDALAIQRETHAKLVAARDSAAGSDAGDPSDARMTVYLLEHDPPVVTVTKRVGAAAHVRASDAALAALGVEKIETDRGGDVTYHGPGQLVAYPILDIQRLGLKVHPYVRWLEQCLLDTLREDGLAGLRDPTATGVWVGAEGRPDRKIAAIGVRLSRFVTLHGFALNVAPDLSHFGLIVPCGLERPVTSLSAELGARVPSMDTVKLRVAAWFAREVESRLLHVGRE